MNVNGELSALEGSGPSLSPISNTILRCLLCQKPFIQESSYNRHMSYCRKTQNRQRIRNRACRACNAAKTKCTFERTCHRCRLMGLHCSYGQPGSTTETSRRHEPFGRAPANVPGKPSTAPTNFAAREEPRILDTAQTESGPRLSDFDFDSMMHIDLIGPLSAYPGGPLANIPDRDKAMGSATETHNNTHNSAPSEIRSEHGMQLQIYQKLGTLARLQPADPVVEHNARLIMQSIRAYPYMMLRRETFPPFIHPHWHRQSTPALPWPLANCISIAKLFVSRTSETTAFLWQAVKSESQRCLDEMMDFSEECLLAAIQVQVMYLIFRLVDGVTQPGQLDLQLLTAFKVLCQHLKTQHDGDYFGCQPHDWDSWIHAESRVRIIVVFFLISRVISVFTDMNCAIVERYRDFPLCSSKGPWEAKSSAAWVSEYSACTHTKDAGLCTIGQMIDLQGADRNDTQARTLDSWNAAADNLGILLNSVTLGLAHA